MTVCYIGIGSNLGNRKKNIKKAIGYLKEIKNIRLDKVSRIYETEPLGGPKQKKFLNAAARVKTTLKPAEFLRILKDIEKKLGRKKTVRYGPRSIDLDILLYGNEMINKKNLKVPHPRMFRREFVLRPLSEVI